MMINLTNLTFNDQVIELNDYSVTVCGQLHGYVIITGIIVSSLYVLGTIFCNWYFTKGYKHYIYRPNTNTAKVIGNLHIKETRLYWDQWIRNRLSKLLLGFVIVIIYLNW